MELLNKSTPWNVRRLLTWCVHYGQNQVSPREQHCAVACPTSRLYFQHFHRIRAQQQGLNRPFPVNRILICIGKLNKSTVTHTCLALLLIDIPALCLDLDSVLSDPQYWANPSTEVVLKQKKKSVRWKTRLWRSVCVEATYIPLVSGVMMRHRDQEFWITIPV